MRGRKTELEDLEQAAEEAEGKLAANLARREALSQEHKKLTRDRGGDATAVELLEIEHRLRQIERERERLEVEAQTLGAQAIRARTAYGQASRRLREARETLERLRGHPERFNRYSRWQVSQIEQQCNDVIKELTR